MTDPKFWVLVVWAIDPWPRQKDQAKRVALQYYRRLLDLSPTDGDATRLSDELTREVVTAWSFCAD